MERLTALQQRQKTSLLQEAALHDDPLWELAQRVVAGPHFARSPLLSKFLLFVRSRYSIGALSTLLMRSASKVGLRFGRPFGLPETPPRKRPLAGGFL